MCVCMYREIRFIFIVRYRYRYMYTHMHTNTHTHTGGDMDDEGEQATPLPKIVEYVMDKEALSFFLSFFFRVEASLPKIDDHIVRCI